MGLFSKKPKSSAPVAVPVAPEQALAAPTLDAPTLDAPQLEQIAAPAAPAPAATPAPAPRSHPQPQRLPRKVDPAEFVALRSELLDVRARLEASEQAKAVVEARLAALDATTTAIATGRLGGDDVRVRLDELEGELLAVSAASSAALTAAESAANKASAASALAADSQHAPVDPVLAARVEALAARVESLPDITASVQPAATEPAPLDPAILERIESLAAQVQLVDQLGAQLAELNNRVTAQTSQLEAAVEATTAAAAAAAAATAEPTPVATPAPAVDEALVAQVAQLAERVATTDTSTRQAVELVNTLQQRLTSISTELANQMRELSTDIDGLAGHQDDVAKGTVDDAVVEALKTAQVRLAAEQARYEIAFRQDLAALAEQVRHSPKR